MALHSILLLFSYERYLSKNLSIRLDFIFFRKKFSASETSLGTKFLHCLSEEPIQRATVWKRRSDKLVVGLNSSVRGFGICWISLLCLNTKSTHQTVNMLINITDWKLASLSLHSNISHRDIQQQIAKQIYHYEAAAIDVMTNTLCLRHQMMTEKTKDRAHTGLKCASSWLKYVHKYYEVQQVSGNNNSFLLIRVLIFHAQSPLPLFIKGTFTAALPINLPASAECVTWHSAALQWLLPYFSHTQQAMQNTTC